MRAGTYQEAPNFWDKNIWLESSEGPEVTIIDAENLGWGVFIGGFQDTTACVRGFTIRNSLGIGINISWSQASPKIFNNIVSSHSTSSIRTSINRCIIRNNIFTNTIRSNVELFISYGVFENNMVIHSESYALWNTSALDINPIVPDYNLIWDYQRLMNEPEFELGPNNIIDQNPLFEEGSFILQVDSPAIDSGRQDLLDLDGSRSDIGVYGGPYSYPIPN